MKKMWRRAEKSAVEIKEENIWMILKNFILEKITNSINEIKKLETNNKTLIKCINTQIMSVVIISLML